jgi:spore germination cell wall hydrolase CwlJ-like protein
MVGAGLRWAFATVSPWVLAAAVLVSISADAGVDATFGGYEVVSPSPALAIPQPSRLVPGVGTAELAVAPRFSIPGQSGMVHTVRLPDPDSPVEPSGPLFPPRDELKTTVQGFPNVNRVGKGDALVTLRPAVDLLPLAPARPPVLSQDSELLPPTILMPMGDVAPGLDSVARFEPEADFEATTPRAGLADNSPTAGHSELTAAARASGTTTTGVGSTPSVPRAMALSSTTPAPSDATPVEIAAAPVSPDGLAALRARGGGMTEIPRTEDGRPSYASLIDPQAMSREERCLAEAVYFEARSEPEAGQAAVAQVVLNRVKSGLYPTSVCGVVYQNRNRKFACQFSFACEGKALRISEPDSWETAVRIAREVTFGETYNSEVGGATHYHANYVRPFWAKRLKKMDVIGRHIFYKLKPGQT